MAKEHGLCFGCLWPFKCFLALGRSFQINERLLFLLVGFRVYFNFGLGQIQKSLGRGLSGIIHGPLEVILKGIYHSV